METKNINKMKKNIENKIALNSRIIVRTNLFFNDRVKYHKDMVKPRYIVPSWKSKLDTSNAAFAVEKN